MMGKTHNLPITFWSVSGFASLVFCLFSLTSLQAQVQPLLVEAGEGIEWSSALIQVSFKQGQTIYNGHWIQDFHFVNRGTQKQSLLLSWDWEREGQIPRDSIPHLVYQWNQSPSSAWSFRINYEDWNEVLTQEPVVLPFILAPGEAGRLRLSWRNMPTIRSLSLADQDQSPLLLYRLPLFHKTGLMPRDALVQINTDKGRTATYSSPLQRNLGTPQGARGEVEVSVRQHNSTWGEPPYLPLTIHHALRSHTWNQEPQEIGSIFSWSGPGDQFAEALILHGQITRRKLNWETMSSLLQHLEGLGVLDDGQVLRNFLDLLVVGLNVHGQDIPVYMDVPLMESRGLLPWREGRELLRFIINTYHALEGYEFQNPELKTFYEARPWYQKRRPFEPDQDFQYRMEFLDSLRRKL